MKVLHKFIIKSYLGPMVLTFFIVLFIFVMQFLWLYIDEIVGKGLSWGVVLELMGWVSLTSVPMALPLATLFASLMTMGNLGENNELLAIKAAGISLQRIMRPLFVLIFVVVVIGGFFANNNLVPYSHLKMRSLLYDVKKKRPELAIPDGIFFSGLENYSIRIGKKDPVTHVLKGVMLYDHSKNKGNVSLTIADSGYIKQSSDQKYLIFKLYNGRAYEEHLDNYNQFTPNRGFSRRWFDEQNVVIPLDDADFKRTDEGLFKGYAQMQNVVELEHSYDSLSIAQKRKVQDFSKMISHTSVVFDMVRELDTITEHRNQYIHNLNIDSIFQNLSTAKKVEVYNWAITKAETGENQFEAFEAEFQTQSKQVRSLQIEWHRKFTLAVACIIFFFIGAPLGAIIRKGGLGMPMVVSVLFFVVYWVIDITCKKLAQNGTWNPIIASWFPSLILAPIGVFLTYKAASDSSLFNPDKYFAFINKIFGRVKQLIVKVNLDTVVQVQVIPSVDSLNDEILEINKLCAKYSAEYKLENFIVLSTSKWLLYDDEGKLKDIEQKYNQLISYLASIDNNERLREQLRQCPLLESSKYKFPKTNVLMRLLFLILFPIGFVIYILILNRRKKLKYILSEIVEINNTISIALKIR